MKKIAGVNYYTTAEVAAVAEVSKTTVWRWAKTGRVQAFRMLTGDFVFPEGVVESLRLVNRLRPVHPTTQIEEAKGPAQNA